MMTSPHCTDRGRAEAFSARRRASPPGEKCLRCARKSTNTLVVGGGSRMAGWKHYHTPHSIEEALELLREYAGSARVVGGGTDLLLELQHGHRPPQEALIDITRIPSMTQIAQSGDSEATIGAGVTHTQIVESALLADRATCLVESCGVVGGPQVRNVGTLGGNVAHALPAGDGT